MWFERGLDTDRRVVLGPRATCLDPILWEGTDGEQGVFSPCAADSEERESLRQGHRAGCPLVQVRGVEADGRSPSSSVTCQWLF